MKPQTREILSLAALSTLLLGMLAPNAAATDDAPEGPGRVEAATVLTEDLGGIPAQSTPSGKRISAMALHQGRLYLGYGDYGVNTGSIDLYSYDAQSGDRRLEIQVPTEATGSFLESSGKLYAPYLDPKTAPSKLNGFATNRDGSWKNVEPIVDMIHNFSMESTDGENLFVAGSMRDPSSNRNYAAIWYSADGATNWQLIRRETSPSSGDQTQDRYYWIKAYEGKLYASASIRVGTTNSYLPKTMSIWEDGEWSSVALPADTTAGLDVRAPGDIYAIGDKLISARVDPKSSPTDRVKNPIYSLSENRRIDTSETTTDVDNPWDPENGQYFTKLTKSGETLYGMTGGGMLYSTTDGLKWTYAMTVSDLFNPGPIAVDKATKKIYIAMDASPFAGIGSPVPQILTATIPDAPTPENPGSGSAGGFCVKASSEHAGKTLTAAAGGRDCAGLKSSD